MTTGRSSTAVVAVKETDAAKELRVFELRISECVWYAVSIAASKAGNTSVNEWTANVCAAFTSHRIRSIRDLKMLEYSVYAREIKPAITIPNKVVIALENVAFGVNSVAE